MNKFAPIQANDYGQIDDENWEPLSYIHHPGEDFKRIF